MIPVTKPYFPSRQRLDKYLDGIYGRQWLTNNGQLVRELTVRLEEYLGVRNLLLVANGTLALQIAYRALGVSGSGQRSSPEAVTTPFTFVATASALKWEGVQPVFADIDPKTWCLNPANIVTTLTRNTRAIVPVHVFGNACDVETIGRIADERELKVIYDASHAFGVKIRGQSILDYGDASTLSFHATKLFHTGEGGAIVFRYKEDLERAKKMINFGITGPETIEELGINAKMNELQAAMGLCVLDELEDNIRGRSHVWHRYKRELPDTVQLQAQDEAIDYNYAYFPAVFESEAQLLRVVARLKNNGVLGRRYFYPSLESIAFFGAQAEQPVSRYIASRILCLPIFDQLPEEDQTKIICLVTEELEK